MTDFQSLGNLIRKYRKIRRLNLVDLAEKCNISPSFLSQIERGQANPSIPTLYVIADTLEISVADMFSAPDPESTREEPGTFSTNPTEVVRSDRRKVIIYPDKGIRSEFLTSSSKHAIQLLWIVMPPGADSGEEPFIHLGEECGVVLQGKLETTVGSQRFLLGPGDSIYHDSTLPHCSRNVGDEDVVVVVAKTHQNIDFI